MNYDYEKVSTNIINNIDDYSLNLILSMISNLEESDKKRLLSNNYLKEKLFVKILDLCKKDSYRAFRMVLDYISIEDFISLLNIDMIKEAFGNNYKEYEYKLFVALAESDINRLIECIFDADKMFLEFYNLNYYYYSLFSNINYDNFKKSILKLEQYGLPKNSFISSVSEEYQRKIINEPLKEDTLVWIIKGCKYEVKNDFFKNDDRAIKIYKEFNVISLIESKIEFNDSILEEDEFFEELKGGSLVDFRKTINLLEERNNTENISKRVIDYYKKLLASFDKDANMFQAYKQILDDPSLTNLDYDKYIYDTYVRYEIRKSILSNNKEELEQYLIDYTSKKISEIVVDALFQDNFYNVKINIKEMLRFNSTLSESALSEESIAFYEMICDFDNISSQDKINIFNEYYSKNVYETFYDDMRLIRDISYQKISDNLFNTKSTEFIPNEISGVKVYDLRKENYYMFIRGMVKYKNNTRSARSCYSLISNENTSYFGSDDYMTYYGYNSFNSDQVSHVFESDSFSNNTNDGSPSDFINRIMTPEEIVKTSFGYSEIDLINYQDENGNMIAKKPDFIVSFNYVNEKEIQEAKRLNIPIVLIQERHLSPDEVIGNVSNDKSNKYILDSFDEQIAKRM